LTARIPNTMQNCPNRAATGRLMVMGRYPVPGRTKTRLIRVLGPVGAAELHRRLVEETLSKAASASRRSGLQMELCYEGGSERQMRRWLGNHLRLKSQTGPDLGARMETAFSRAFQEGSRRAILIGTDVPEFTTDHLVCAYEALNRCDLVIGPSTDGGYWLLGAKRLHPFLFRGIQWGTDTVLQSTLGLARKGGLRTFKLEPLSDVDRPADLEVLKITSPSPYASVVIPVLNERERIESAVRSALDRDAEVLVIDGGSTDCTVSRASAMGIRVEAGPRGRAIQQNTGAAISRGSVLVFLHADTRLPSGYVASIFEALMERNVGFGAFSFQTDLHSPWMRCTAYIANLRSRRLGLPYGDQALFFKRSLFEAVGGFPNVAVAEDLVMVRRVSQNGRPKVLPVPVTTSSRRWKGLGFARTTLNHWIILAGYFLGISFRTLHRLHQVRPPEKRRIILQQDPRKG